MLQQPPFWLILIAFVCMIGPLVFFHELGHYVVAKLFGVGVETFSIGFGREIVGWTDRSGTRWKVGWLPLGGFVRFIGDMNPASTPVDADEIPEELRSRSFHLKPVWHRFLIVLAGPAANFLLAILIYTAIFSLVYSPATNKIGSVAPRSAAAAAGLERGDRILSIAGQETLTFDKIQSLIEQRPNMVVKIEFKRKEKTQQVALRVGSDELTDSKGRRTRIGLLGVTAAPVSVFKAVPLATKQVIRITGWVLEGVAKMISGEASREDVGGPIKIAQFAGQAASLGALPFIQLLAVISINLGFINLLPVPVLDGGHLFFYAVEAVRRRPVSLQVQDWAFRGGLALVLALLLFITFNDLGSFGLWDRLGRLIG